MHLHKAISAQTTWRRYLQGYQCRNNMAALSTRPSVQYGVQNGVQDGVQDGGGIPAKRTRAKSSGNLFKMAAEQSNERHKGKGKGQSVPS